MSQKVCQTKIQVKNNCGGGPQMKREKKRCRKIYGKSD